MFGYDTAAITFTGFEGVAVGLAAAEVVLAEMEADIRWSPSRQDGDAVAPGDVLAEVSGSARDLPSFPTARPCDLTMPSGSTGQLMQTPSAAHSASRAANSPVSSAGLPSS